MHRVIAHPRLLPALTLVLFVLSAAPSQAAPPDGLILSRTTLAENAPPMTHIGTFTALDPDPNDTHRFVLIENPLDLFEIQGEKLIAVEPLDFEAAPRHAIRVRVYDDTNAWLERSFTIQVLDRNDPPLGAVLSTPGTPETTPVFGLVGAFTQVGDPDQDELHTFRLLDDADGRFVLEGNQLRTSSLLDHETHPLHALTVEVKDRAGLTATATVLLHVWDRNEPPLGATLTPSLISEDASLGTTVGSLAAFGDPDRGELHTFLLVGGDPGFALDGPLLKVGSRLDFETNPVRTVRVRVTDRGGLFTEVPVTVFLEDANDPPTALTLLGGGLPENAAPMTPAGLLVATDPDAADAAGHHFELVDAEDETRFLIEDDTLLALTPFDHESTPTVAVRVRATDLAGLSFVATVTVPIADLNEAPTAIELTTNTVPETASNNTIVGFLSVADPDTNDTHELYLLQDGLGAFRIDNNRILRKSGPLDFETSPTVTLTAIAFDRARLFLVQTLTVTVLDVDEPATGLAVDPPSISENQPIGTTVGTLIPIGDPDRDKGYTFTLVENPGNRFSIVGDRLVANQVFDFETARSYPIRVRAIPETGAPLEQNLSIEVRDEPEPPTGLAISGNLVPENRNPGTFVATLSAQGDPDAGELHTFSLVENPGEAFAVSGNTLSTAKLLDFETRASYPITVRATDRSGLYVDVPLEVRVTDLNEPPTGVDLAPRTIAESSPPNSVVGRLSPVGDPDAVDRHVYGFVSNPGDLFDIVGDTLVARTPFDFETPPTSFRLVIRVSDQGNLTAETVFFVTTADVNEPPSPIALANRSLPENAPAGTVVDLITGGVDPDLSDISNFEILDHEGFAVDSERRLVTTRPFDHESEPELTVTVRLTDGGGHEVSATWPITIDDVPEPATAVALSQLTVPESAPLGAVVGTLSAVLDPDRGDTHGFAVSADPDGVFAVATGESGPALVTRRALDFEKQATHQVSITATDSAGLTVTTTFQIEVLDENDRPTSRAELALPPIDEDTFHEPALEVATLLTGLAASDADGDPVTLLVASTTADGAVAGTWELQRAEPDPEPGPDPAEPDPDAPTNPTWTPLSDGLELHPGDRLRFAPAPDQHGLATLTVRAYDGQLSGGPASVLLEVRSINDAPRHGLGAARIQTSEQARTDIQAALGAPLTVNDVDAELLAVTLTTPRGTLSLPTTDLVVTAGALDSDTLTVSGAIPALNAALGALVFMPAPRFTGETELIIESDDLGASGAGGPQLTTDSIPIVIQPGPDLVVLYDGEPVPPAGQIVPERLGAQAFNHVRLVLENRGSRPLYIERNATDPARGDHGLVIASTDNADAWLAVRPGLELGPGQAESVMVTVRPRAAGPASVGLAISSNDPEPVRWTATISKTATLSPDLAIHDGTRELHDGLVHDVAELTSGETRRLELELENNGAARLELFEATIAEQLGVEVLIEEPFPILDPGESDTLVVYLTPLTPLTTTTHSRARALIEIPTTDPEAPLFQVHLRAEIVDTPTRRLTLERVPGVPISPGLPDDVGYARLGRDLPLALRLTNLGTSRAKPSFEVLDPANANARLAVSAPDMLLSNTALELSLFIIPEAAGPFSVTLQIDDESWLFTGRALGLGEPTPGNAIALYRRGGTRLALTDALGPVTPGLPETHAWLLVNEGPEALTLTQPLAIARRINNEAWPTRQPPSQLPVQRAALLPLVVEPLSAGALELQLLAAGYPEVRVHSEGQVGQIALAIQGGRRLAPFDLVQLPVQRVGERIDVSVQVMNDGNGPLTLAIPTLTGDPACLGVTRPSQGLVTPGAVVPLTVSITPSAGLFSCTLTVFSDDLARPSFEVTFAARGTNVGKREDGCGGAPGSTLVIALLSLLFIARARRRSSR